MNVNGQTFAYMHWEDRWNANKGVCAQVDRDGVQFIATGPMGVVHIDRDDVPFFVKQMRVFLLLLEKEAGN